MIGVGDAQKGKGANSGSGRVSESRTRKLRIEFIITGVEFARYMYAVTKDGWHGYDKAML